MRPQDFSDVLKAGNIPVAWREPFSDQPIYRQYNRHGETIEEIVLSVPNLPERFLDHGVVFINGRRVERALWIKTRPLPDRPDRPIMVTLHMPMAGGGRGGGAKQIFGLVASLALLFVTGGIAGGLFATQGLFAAGSLSARILAGAVGLVGALAIGALTAPPTVKNKTQNDDTKEAASASGNVQEPGGAISTVIGTRKVFPNLIGDPIIDLIDQDEFLEAAFVLNGPHKITDIRVENNDISEAEDIVYQVREGWQDDAPLTYVTRQGKLTAPQIQMSEHVIDQVSKHQLKTKSTALIDAIQNTDPTTKLPKWHGAATRRGPDEVWIHFLFGGGLGFQETSEPFHLIAVPLRIRIRPRGAAAWINLPEVMVAQKALKQFRYGIKFFFGVDQPVDIPLTGGAGWVYARNNVPGQSIAPTTDGWLAHSHFIGAGDPYLNRFNYGSTGCINTRLTDSNVEFYLNGVAFPRAIYDVQIKRGCALGFEHLNQATYQYDADGSPVFDYFYYNGTVAPYLVAVDQEKVVSQMIWSRIISVWNEYPVQQAGFALIGIKALNRSVQQLSCVASRYVKDWDGSGWNRWKTTSNPAPHYADVLCGIQNGDPLPQDLRDDQGLLRWRSLCEGNDWTCDAIVDDFRTQDVLTLLASSSYAKPYQSETYGVAIDSDRSSESPVQIFSQRNSRDFSFEKAFARLPDGFIVNFHDRLADYDNSQIFVFRDGYSGGPFGTMETITYDSLVEEDKATTRAFFDLQQAELRSTFYNIVAPAAAIRCQRGDLVALQNDVLIQRSGAATVQRILRSDGMVIGFDLDLAIQVMNEIDMHAVGDMLGIKDMHVLGMRTGIAIRRSDDSISTHELSDATGLRRTVTLATPVSVADGTFDALIDTDYERGSQIVSGELGEEYHRALVFSISPQKDFEFQITLVDEAPGLLRLVGHLVTDDTGTQMTDDDGTEMMDD